MDWKSPFYALSITQCYIYPPPYFTHIYILSSINSKERKTVAKLAPKTMTRSQSKEKLLLDI